MLSRGGVNPQRCRHRGGRELCWKHPPTIGVLGGDHVISVKKNGYQYWESDIAADLEADVKQEQKTEAAVTVQTPTDHPAALRETTGATPAETLGTLSLTSSPYGAEIYSDSVFVGKTSATLRLKPGRHNILLMIIDYKNWSREITADAGAKPDLAAAMEKSN
jgi:hypothetical protein